MSNIVIIFFCTVFYFTGSLAQEKYSTPRWSRQAVWYQIFPERFNNGDTANDPAVTDMQGSWPHDEIKEWNISPWNSDWYKLQQWEEKNEKGFYYNTQLRRYGGDLQGVITKLDYLQTLGITALYLNPIFESPSLHKYDATMYHHVDNNFGPNPALDKKIWSQENPVDPSTWKWTSADSLFLTLIKECHKRNIKIIIDGVFNHVGMTFWAFRDVQKNGTKSAFVDWFTIHQFDDSTTVENEFRYEGWFGVKELPELREDGNGFPQAVKDHIHAVVRRWMDPNNDGNPEDGIDGWRLDVADMVNINFWKEFRRWTREINPESYLVGEAWWEDWQKNKMYDPTPWIADGAVFDAVMNYRLTVPILNYFTDKKNRISSTEFAKRVTTLFNQFSPDVTQVQMNTLDSHDTDRLPSIIVNPDRWFDHEASTKDNAKYNVRKPTAVERAVQKLVVLFQMTTVGAPTIYYGNEAGMWGGDDPDERKPMVWNDMAFKPETSHPFNEVRPADSVFFERELFDYYKKLVLLRKNTPALALGSFKFVTTDDIKDVIAYVREVNDVRIIVCINNSTKVQTIQLSKKVAGNSTAVTEMLTGKKISLRSQFFDIVMQPKSGAVLTGTLSQTKKSAHTQ